MEVIVFIVGIRCIIGGVCALIASHKGRTAAGWFFAGFFLDIIGLVIVLIVSNLKEQENQRLRLETEQRRLSEQLRQERLKNEALRQHVAGRLDVHDQLLSVDTRGLTELPAGSPAASLPAPSRSGAEDGTLVEAAEAPRPLAEIVLPPADPDAKRWYYHRDGASLGPLTENDLKQMFTMKRLALSTLVWAQELGNWMPAERLPVFRDAVGS